MFRSIIHNQKTNQSNIWIVEIYLLVVLVGWFSNKFQEFYKVCSTSKEISAPWRFWLPLVLTRLGWHWRMPRMRWNESLFSNNIFRGYSDISKLFRRANAAYDIGNVFMLGFGDQELFYQFCHFKESVLKFGWDEKSSWKNWTFLHTDGFDFSAPNWPTD